MVYNDSKDPLQKGDIFECVFKTTKPKRMNYAILKIDQSSKSMAAYFYVEWCYHHFEIWIFHTLENEREKKSQQELTNDVDRSIDR